MTDPQTGAEIPVHLQIQTETFSAAMIRKARRKIRMKHYADRNLNADDLNTGELVLVSNTLYQFDYIDDEYVHITDEYGCGFTHDIRSFELSATRKEGMFTDFMVRCTL